MPRRMPCDNLNSAITTLEETVSQLEQSDACNLTEAFPTLSIYDFVSPRALDRPLSDLGVTPQRILEHLSDIMENPNSTARERIAAINTLRSLLKDAIDREDRGGGSLPPITAESLPPKQLVGDCQETHKALQTIQSLPTDPDKHLLTGDSYVRPSDHSDTPQPDQAETVPGGSQSDEPVRESGTVRIAPVLKPGAKHRFGIASNPDGTRRDPRKGLPGGNAPQGGSVSEG